MMIAIPVSLTLSRLVLGPLALWLALQGADRAWFGWILWGGLLSDYSTACWPAG
jgi:phosphatidylglycerophosphate synthase